MCFCMIVPRLLSCKSFLAIMTRKWFNILMAPYMHSQIIWCFKCFSARQTLVLSHFFMDQHMNVQVLFILEGHSTFLTSKSSFFAMCSHVLVNVLSGKSANGANNCAEPSMCSLVLFQIFTYYQGAADRTNRGTLFRIVHLLLLRPTLFLLTMGIFMLFQNI